MNFFKHYENMYKNWQHEHFPNKTQQGITKEEALKILGLKEGASEKEIKAAHVKLITKYHPDKADGSEYFAQKINQARDILLK
ncbi:MAG: J domain-containing protein [Sphingobacteriia bacterium]|nr:J domain-containing protein [Sphingobacteriia bacterium]